MAELKNTFSWSFSAAADFEECRRRRYWSKYGKWGGWDSNASPVKKKAYQLDKMGSFYSILGQAVEKAAMHILRKHQAGETCGVEEAYTKVARDYMNRAWKESKSGKWRQNPKKFCCLREHYYETMPDKEQKDLTARMVEHAKTCLANFTDKALPRIADVSRGMEFPIQTPETPGDAEHFYFGGVKIYAIPDYAYRKGGVIHIHDWKAGKQKSSHRDQLEVYGLWAATTHRKADEDICVYAEYLKDGEIVAGSIGEEDLERVKTRIETSVADMTELLVSADRERNEPLPMEEWELALSPQACKYCNFYELCEQELRETGVV